MSAGKAPRHRRAITLLELVMVTVLLGIFVAIAASRIGPDSLANANGGADARRLAMDLLQARRRAIATGDNHYLQFTTRGSGIAGYTVYRDATAGATPATEYRAFSTTTVVTSSSRKPEFEFSGSALATYTFTVAGTRTWQVQVIQSTGAVTVAEL